MIIAKAPPSKSLKTSLPHLLHFSNTLRNSLTFTTLTNTTAYFFVIPEFLNRESRVFNDFWIPGQARNDG
jgi:hypothetical protein